MLEIRACFTYLFLPSSEAFEHPAGVAMEAGSHGEGGLDFGFISGVPPALESLFQPKAPAVAETHSAYLQALWLP